VVFLEHKLLSRSWLEFLGQGNGMTIVTLAVGVHRAIAAGEILAHEGIDCEVIDLRSVQPVDRATVTESARQTGRLLLVDEDYREFGLSGELAATVLEAGLSPRFARVCLDQTISYARHLEECAPPNVDRIVAAALRLALEPCLDHGPPPRGTPKESEP
jgi:pyruvate dehydrogenase E1 component beta subunit